jgi:hypothetical protein
MKHENTELHNDKNEKICSYVLSHHKGENKKFIQDFGPCGKIHPVTEDMILSKTTCYLKK